MKRLLVLLLVIVICLACFASCDKLPDSVKDKLDPVLDKIGLGSDDHEHEFVKVNEKAATCTAKGKITYECSCGETKTDDIPAAHDYKIDKVEEPSCTKPGNNRYVCDVCGSRKNETFGSPTGHDMGEFVEQSRLILCKNDRCSYGILPEGNGKYAEVIVYKFVEDDLDRFDAIYAELDALIQAADDYDEEQHKYSEGDPIPQKYLDMESKYEELYDELEYVTAQYQIAQIEYHVNLNDKTKENNYNYISELRTELVARFYSFSQPIYESEFRDIYYVGMTPEEIKSFIFESNAVANEDYKAAVDSNTQIENQFLEIDPSSSQVPELYAQLVENNKTIANILGYDNYVEYAYENVYDRDYSYTDAKIIVDYVKKYISPVYNKIYSTWNSAQESGKITYEIYQACTSGNFFSTYEQNKSLNDYMDLMELNGEKYVTFSDELNKLMGDGNMFRGLYQGAYVTSLYGMDLPIAYFGGSYSDFFTVAHEFGHYMNEIYSGGKYSQSYDLLEMHSQGNEMLFLAYLNLNKGSIAYENLDFYNIYQPLNMFFAVMNAIAIDVFEQAVYTDTYEGTYADEIMLDGKITADEYDLLYEGIVKDFGCGDYMSTDYWRYVTILSPCYYISYSVSALSVLQLMPMAMEDFDAASEAYCKLFTYVDEYESDSDYMTTEQTLQYAGLMSFKDEELYKYISEYFLKMLS